MPNENLKNSLISLYNDVRSLLLKAGLRMGKVAYSRRNISGRIFQSSISSRDRVRNILYSFRLVMPIGSYIAHCSGVLCFQIILNGSPRTFRRASRYLIAS